MVFKALLIVVLFLELVLLLYYLINKNIKREFKLLIMFNFIMIVISLIFLEFNFFNNLVLTVLTLIILKLLFDNNELQNRYNKIIKYLVEYEKIIDEQGKKNHEYNNQLLILKGYINNKNKLKEYLNTIIDDHRVGQNYEIKQLSNLKDTGLKELLYYKISMIKEKNIKYYLYVSEETIVLLESLSISFYKDITKVFGVLIDNAIEASLDSKEKELELDFSSENNQIVITISNSYNKKININDIGEKGFTTKGKGHGFGLKIVNDIVKRNKKIEVITSFDDKYFVQTIFIYI